jgi:DNA-3-methyladenine glycosylase
MPLAYNGPMLPDLSDSVTAAQTLLGWKLVHDSPDGLTSGYIVETEAYSQSDPASHTYGGKRLANAAMFEPAGTIYVYFTYGMHYCVNIVTGAADDGQAVLIRALQPVDGIDLMKRRRGTDQNLCNGPARLVQAMGITPDYSGKHLLTAELRLEPGFEPAEIVQTTRIGISKAVDQPWRFYVAGSEFVSRPVKR